MTDARCEDWRHATADVVARLLADERHRWIDALHWDMSGSFELPERARSAGHAAVFLAYDRDGDVAGGPTTRSRTVGSRLGASSSPRARSRASS